MRTSVSLLAAMLLSACAAGPKEVHLEGGTMGTTWHLTVLGDFSDLKTTELREAVQARLDELDLAFTNWRESPLTRFNASRSDAWQSVPAELATMVLFARELSEKTNGAFDVTLSPVVDLWGFGPKGRVSTPPSAESIKSAMTHVDWRKLEARADPPALRKLDPDLQINVSAMADGFACDDIAKLLRSRGFPRFLIEIGGAVLGSGTNAQNRPWNAGIQRPHAITGETLQAIPLKNQALSTSGVYRQYFENGGQRYPHVLDARTGRPITHDLVSVSVINDSAFFADGWDTALLILGPDAGRSLAKKLGIDALFIAESK